jgi:pyrophosphatase PpaX
MEPGVVYKAILFDLDGTLLDSRQANLISIRRLFCEFSRKQVADEHVESLFGLPSWEAVHRIAPGMEQTLLDAWMSHMEDLHQYLHLFPGVADLLKALSQAGIPLGVVTSQDQRELDIVRCQVQMGEWIRYWVTIDDVQHAKPHPEGVLTALHALNCPPKDALLIGDTHYDLEAGRAAGTAVGLSLWGRPSFTERLEERADFVFHHPEEVAQLCLQTRQ